MPVCLTQNNWLFPTKQNKSPYIPVVRVLISTQFQVS